MKEIPILFNKREECCGCSACYAVCTHNAISMRKDKEGFEYPYIDALKCVRCYICKKVCPFDIKK